jgi:hypothetical protein
MTFQTVNPSGWTEKANQREKRKLSAYLADCLAQESDHLRELPHSSYDPAGFECA